ncbi:LOW QUALITY PROTEIN: hypothetical protein PRUPE_3G201600, partial [Prunus persica]
GESKLAKQINETDLQAAMADMRMSSYHGFVILFSSSIPKSLRNTNITFFMPNDQELSSAASSPRIHPQPFDTTALNFGHLLHFANGSLVPSGTPSKIISVTHSRRSGLFLNNAKIVTPYVSNSSTIRCHGISTTMAFRTLCSFQ